MSVLDEHLPWEDFFASQGPFGGGDGRGLSGEAALEEEAARLEAVMLALAKGASPAEWEWAASCEPMEAAGAALLESFSRLNQHDGQRPPALQEEGHNVQHDEL